MFDRVKILQVAGKGIRAIVRETAFNWRTVTKWARLGELPEQNVMAAKPTTPATFRTTSRGVGRRDAPQAGICCRRSNV